MGFWLRFQRNGNERGLPKTSFESGGGASPNCAPVIGVFFGLIGSVMPGSFLSMKMPRSASGQLPRFEIPLPLPPATGCVRPLIPNRQAPSCSLHTAPAAKPAHWCPRKSSLGKPDESCGAPATYAAKVVKLKPRAPVRSIPCPRAIAPRSMNRVPFPQSPAAVAVEARDWRRGLTLATN